MKTRYILILFIIGFIVTTIAQLLRLAHWHLWMLNGNLLFLIGTFIEIIAAVLFLYKLFVHPKFKDFLDF
jgi:hypothetical protein